MMKMRIIKHLVFFIILLINVTSFAQEQNNQWRFGFGGALDFNTLPPSFVNGCVIAATEGSASVADRVTGALLFYTDGVTVWNANNQIMPNGTGLLGGVTLSSTTAAVIVPKPGSSNLYYIITVDEFTSNNGVRYSVVDMTLNGGLGDIVAGQKNIFLFQTNEERLEVVPASDGQSYWLLTHNNTNSSFYSFRINNAGIQNTPVVSTVGSAFQINQGHIKINKQFNKVAMGISEDSDIELFDFDNATGVLSNPITLNFNLLSVAFGIEFSPDGKLLYLSDSYSILQLDLTQTTALAIQNSAYQVATVGGVLQLGIDGKIYVAAIDTIDAINCPNKLGAACGYQSNVIATGPSWGGGSSFPKLVYYPNDTALSNSNKIVYSDSCFGNATQFTIQNTAGISSVSWNFGDPSSGTNNTAVGFTASHTFSQIGNYNVRAILTTTCGFDTLFLSTLQIINCTPPPTITGFNIVGDTCNVATNFSFQPIGTTNATSLTWTFDDPNSGANTYVSTPANPNAPHIFSAAGTYNICLTFQEPGFPVTTICKTVHIGQCCNAMILTNGNCLQNSIPFSITTGATVSSVNWNFDDPPSGANNTSTSLTPTHLFSASGTYNIRAIVNLSCGVDTISKTLSIIKCDSVVAECQLFVPSAFTPNNDGKNDKFNPQTICPTEQFECLIYSRWGELIFKTTSQFNQWDGKYKGADCSTGIYVYSIKYKFPSRQPKNAKGTITLLR
jgi:gliding motility-associated-like protein